MTNPKPNRKKAVRRGLLSTARAADARPTEHYAIDQFAEMADRKRDAATRARKHGHQLGPWRKRAGDTYGRQDAWCVDCNKVATVAVEPPAVYGLPCVYGNALTEECGGGR